MDKIVWEGDSPRVGIAPCGCRMAFTVGIVNGEFDVQWTLDRCATHGGTTSRGTDKGEPSPEWDEFQSRET